MVARQASARWFVKLEADSAEEVAVCLSRLQQAQAAGRGAVQTVTRSEERVVCVQWQSSVTYNAARAWVKAAFGKGAADCATAFTLSLKRKLAEDAAPLAGAEKPLEVVVPLTLKLCGIARGEVPSTVYTLEAKLGEGTRLGHITLGRREERVSISPRSAERFCPFWFAFLLGRADSYFVLSWMMGRGAAF